LEVVKRNQHSSGKDGTAEQAESVQRSPLHGFAAERPAGRKCRSIAAQRSAALAPKHRAHQQMRAVPR